MFGSFLIEVGKREEKAEGMGMILTNLNLKRFS